MNITEDSIVWSGQEFLLKDFIDTFPLPQIVKVEEGYHDEFEEDRTLSSSQLLTLHSIKELATVKATVEGSLEVLLPTDSTSKVMIINRTDGMGYFDSVGDLANGFPRFALSENSLTCFNIFANEVFELKKKTKKHREHFLVCNVVNNDRTVEIPFNFKGRFKSLGNCPSVSPTIQDVIHHCKLPCTVKFIDNKLKLLRDDLDRPSGFNLLGPVKLHSVNHYDVVFTTTWEDQNASSVLPLPIDLEIRVVAALGAIQNDKKYSKLCKIAQNKTKSEQLVLKYIRHGPCKVILEDIKDPNVDESSVSEYSDIGPMVPPRNFKSERKPAPDPKKRRTVSTSNVPSNTNYLPSPAKETKHNTYDEESFISVTESGRTRSISLNLDKLPPSAVEEEFADHNTATSPSYLASRSPFRESTKKLGKFFSPLKKGTLKVRSEVKKRAQRSSSDSSRSTSGASSRTTVREASEYREVTPVPGSSADRLNLAAFLTKVNLQPEKDPKDELNIENPDNIKSWSMRDVTEVLRFCHLQMYIEKCKEEKIDGALLSVLDADALTSLGIHNPLHRQKLLKIIGGWLPKT